MKIYRRIFDEHGGASCVYDQSRKLTIPIDAANRDYWEYMALVNRGRAILLDLGEPLPDGVEETEESL